MTPMRRTTLVFGLGLVLLSAPAANAEIVKGVLAVNGAEMS
jgi:hypothetical protein